MIWLWILLGLFSVFMLLVFLGVCKIGAEADERMEREFQKMMESRSQSADGAECQKSGGAGGTASCRGYRGGAPNSCAAALSPQTSVALFAGNGGQLGGFSTD